ncbi:hypothetical protein [Flavobacterium sp. 9]|uniref:hypothetical protein n=1 Tax=Flavobacterium sp. 9 TaxID=2035198 RepID=UPI0011982401|nr:hypothetical protein [Flavobacterium sp. 9]
MEEENWEEIYNELYDLREEFFQKWRKNINDLKYYTKVKENDKRVAEIIDSFIGIVKRHEVLYQVIFDQEDVNYENNKEYMERTGLRKESEFYSYSLKVMDKLEEILN